MYLGLHTRSSFATSVFHHRILARSRPTPRAARIRLQSSRLLVYTPDGQNPTKDFMNIVLISTYELGHQPFGLASPATWLAAAGAQVTCLDLSVQVFAPAAVADAG